MGSVTDQQELAERFEEQRGHLRAVAYRMLGSLAEADDAVQEAWLRLGRAGADDVANLAGWLTTVTGRICLDMLRSRTARREDPLDVHLPDPVISYYDGGDPEHEALTADAVGLALLVVLETLTPAERLAFVLHDLFGVPFSEIGTDRGPHAGSRADAGQPGAPPGPVRGRRAGRRPGPPARGGGRLPGRRAGRGLRRAARAAGSGRRAAGRRRRPAAPAWLRAADPRRRRGGRARAAVLPARDVRRSRCWSTARRACSARRNGRLVAVLGFTVAQRHDRRDRGAGRPRPAGAARAEWRLGLTARRPAAARCRRRGAAAARDPRRPPGRARSSPRCAPRRRSSPRSP